MKYTALTIAASDTSGGAGVQRDLKSFHDNGIWGLSVITGITAQSFEKVYYSNPLSTTEVEIQLKTVFENSQIDAVKIGVIYNRKIMKLISHYLQKYSQNNVIIDPIISASDSTKFLLKKDEEFFKEKFLANADLLTPNIPEAELLSQKIIATENEIKAAGKFLSEKYKCYVLIKGGHFINKKTDKIVDFLIGKNIEKKFLSPKKKLIKSHGTGCLLSSAIAANLAKGMDISAAVLLAKKYFHTQV